MQIDGLKFVILASADVDRSVAFYRDRLNLTLTARFAEFAFFDCGGVTLALSGELARGSPESGHATEIVFGVPSVTAAFDDLSANGIEFVNEPRSVNGPSWAVNLVDPDGHLLSLYGNA
jgi:predicted enzyme related to lactoylglutathione lyase